MKFQSQTANGFLNQGAALYNPRPGITFDTENQEIMTLWTYQNLETIA
jgi:hypothetical protein